MLRFLCFPLALLFILLTACKTSSSSRVLMADSSADDSTSEALTKVDKAMTMLGITKTMMTSPKVTSELLEEMNLSDFNPTLPQMREFLGSAKTAPQPLAPLLRAIREGIVQHPSIIEFIDLAIKKNWFYPFKEMEITLNQIYLIESLTVAMANNPQFVVELQDHILNKRTEYGIKPHSTFSTFFEVFKSTHRFFDSVKTISVDPAITFNRYLNANHGKLLTADQVKKLEDQELISFAEKKSLINFTKTSALDDFSGTVLNVYEAASTEYKKGLKDNAFSGHVLTQVIKNGNPKYHIAKSAVFPKTIQNDFYDSLISRENYYLKDDLTQGWINLYESWNMCFILSELNNLHILFPKLLIPSVLSAKQGDYMYTRVIALWLSINHYTLRQLKKLPEVKGPVNRDEMVRAWGAINKKYADQLVAQTKNLDPKLVQDSYKSFFSMPDANLLKLILTFGR